MNIERGRLCLTRSRGEKILIGDNIRIEVVSVHNQKVRLLIEAPREVKVYREEIWLEIQKEAATGSPAEKPPTVGGDG